MEKDVEICEADSTTLINGRRVSLLPNFESDINKESKNCDNKAMIRHNLNGNGVLVDNKSNKENVAKVEPENENVCDVENEYVVDVENEDNSNRKLCQIPLARVKKIMKSDPDIVNISNEALFLITRATEAFIKEFSSEVHGELIKGKGKTLKMEHLKQVIENQEKFMFLEGIFE